MDEQPFPHTVLQLDTVASSKGGRARSVHLDKALDRVLTATKQRCAFVDDRWFHRVTGDSAILAAPATVPKALIAADFVRELVTALRNFNLVMNEAGRLRVRLAVDHGDVVRHGEFINGTAVTRAARLCDSESLRDALRRNTNIDLAVVLTESFYDDAVVEGDRGVNPAEFTFVHDRVKDREVSGWIWLPGSTNPTRPASPSLHSVPRAEPRRPSGGDTYVRSVDIAGNGVIGSGATQHNHGPETSRSRRD